MIHNHHHGIRGALEHLPAVLSAIKTQSGISLVSTELLPGGEQGAMRGTDATETSYILKVHRNPDMIDQYRSVAQSINRLRTIDYPAPEYIAIGSAEGLTYALIEELPGEPDRPLTTPMLEQLLRLNEKQWEAAPHHNPDWIPEMVDSVLQGYQGFCVVDTLRNHSPQSASILQRIQEVADRCRQIEVPGSDIVHFDFHPANVLSIDDQVSGIIDWDGCQTGDASFDLATTLFYCYHVESHRQTLASEIVNHSGPGALRLYLVHMILRQIDWSIRHHDEAAVSYFVERAERILADL